MGLIDSLNALFSRLRRDTTVRTTTDEVGKPSRPTSAVAALTLEADRASVVKDCREMYANDARAEEVLSTLARDVVKGGFTVQIDDDPMAEKAHQVVDDLMKRLNLLSRLDDWCRLTFRDGDSFLEISVGRDKLIHKVTRKPTLEMHRNSNSIDGFDDPRLAYWWADRLFGTIGPPQDAVWFTDWQIIHARWKHDEGNRYGSPLFSSARAPWKKIREGERDIAIRRKTRSGMRYIHVLEGGDEGAIRRYRAENQAALNDPFAAVSDFFTTVKGGLQTVQGDARLGEIGDIKHHISTWWMASPIPMALMGYGEELNRDVLKEQAAQYERALETVSQWVTAQLLVPLFERAWLLQGICPDNLSYEVVWAVKQAITAELLTAAADAVIKLKATGVFDTETLLNFIAQIVPGINVQDVLDRVEKMQAEEQAKRDYFSRIIQSQDNLDDEENQDDQDKEPAEEPR